MRGVSVSNHPIVKDKMTRLRDKNTNTKDFRELVDEITMLMAYEATRDLKLEEIVVETPLAESKGQVIAGSMPVVIPVLRAGLGMVEGFRKLIPNIRVGHIGLYRNEETLEPVEYYCKLPKNINDDLAIVVDPMLATGGSSESAIKFLKDRGAKNIRLVCILGCPEGVERVQRAYPDVDIYLGHMDEKLNEKGYIVPGLGDAGDRIFGTNI